MRPRGVRSAWRIVTRTYGTWVEPPSRQEELREALDDEFRAESPSFDRLDSATAPMPPRPTCRATAAQILEMVANRLTGESE